MTIVVTYKEREINMFLKFQVWVTEYCHHCQKQKPKVRLIQGKGGKLGESEMPVLYPGRKTELKIELQLRAELEKYM